MNSVNLKLIWVALLFVFIIFARQTPSVLADGPIGPPPGLEPNGESHPPAPVQLPTIILREFLHPQPAGQAFFNGRAMAYDSKEKALWANFDPSRNPETKIYKLNTNGALLQSLNVGVGVGALAYDSNEDVLWAGSYNGLGRVHKISRAGAILQTFRVSQYFSGDPFPGFIDGLAHDPATDTLWLSSDVGNRVINIDKSGDLLSSFAFADVSGNAFDGVNFWNGVVLESRVIQTDTNGSFIQEFGTPGYAPEDLAFDSETFAPKCAVWSNEATFATPRIRAYEVPCPGAPVDITVTIDRVRTLPGGCDDPFDEPDFFPKVKIGTQDFIRPVVNDNGDISPNWVFSTSVLTSDGKVPIHIEIFDSDVAFDDQCDINSLNSKEALDITYDTASGEFSGDSSQGIRLVTNSSGTGSEAAELCFGISQGDHVSVCKIDPAQVLFDIDLDGSDALDFIEGKPAVVLARAVSHGSPNPGALINFSLKFDGVSKDTDNSDLDTFISLGRTELFFTPFGQGDKVVSVTATQVDRVSIVSESVTVKDTEALLIPYVRIDSCSGSNYCYGPVTDYSRTLAQSNENIVSMFPIADSEYDGPDTGETLLGDPRTSVTGRSTDAKRVYQAAKRTFDADAAIGIVPSNYFSYHGRPGAFGVQIGNIRGVLVSERSEFASPQEIAHVYDLEHKTAQTSGYYVRQKRLIQNVANMMCSGDPACVFANPPAVWIDDETYKDLFDEFRTNKNDPQVLIVAGTIHRDDTVVLDTWYRLEAGTPTALISGDYSFSFFDSEGNLVDSVSYTPSFAVNIEPIGTFEIDESPFAFTIPYPSELIAKVTLSRGDQVLAEVEPNSKLLKDAINLIPDSGFIAAPEERRKALLQKVEAFETILERADANAAINKLELDIRDHVVKWVQEFDSETPLQPTRDEVLGLIDDILLRLKSE